MHGSSVTSTWSENYTDIKGLKIKILFCFESGWGKPENCSSNICISKRKHNLLSNQLYD
jgi:hypothetical protein